MTVRLVLDESALLGYARLRGVAVGELVAMVQEDDGRSLVGIPAACFLTAYADLDDGAERDRLVDLATMIDGVTAILPLLGSDTVEVAQDGGRGGGQAIIEVRRHGALLATYAGAAARERLPEDAVLDL